MIAFHNDPDIKARYVARVEGHRAADEIIHGVPWEHGKGCAVGCTLHSYNHSAYESELGIPVGLAYLEDRIFEALPKAKAKDWPVMFLSSIPVGADLSGVLPLFLAWLMDDPQFGMAAATADTEVRALALDVARRYRTGDDLTGPKAQDLSDRLSVAWHAWHERDAWVAWVAWVSRAAWVMWGARDPWAARNAFVAASATELLRLLANAPAGTHSLAESAR